MKPGDRIKLKIEKCAFGGDGIAYHGNQVVFVSGALPGELLIAEITGTGRDFLRARPLEWGEVSPQRIESEPKAAEKYPECAYLHTSYEYETQLKEEQLGNFIRQSGCADPAEVLLESRAPEPGIHYRNKLVLQVNKENGRPEIGYVGADKQSVTPVAACPLARPEINDFLSAFLADPGSAHSVHHRMKLTFRFTENDGVKFWRNNAPKNASWLRETTSVGRISVPTDGFFQVNLGGAEALIAELHRLIGQYRPEKFLDLYCGAGLFAVAAAAKDVPEIAGAEQAADSAAAAAYNLKQRGRRPDILPVDAAAAMPELLSGAPDKTLLLVDPPRQGLSGEMGFQLNRRPAGGRLAYISCHPATWARDAARLKQGGWRLDEVRLINQFGRTAHFELFSCFTKEK